MRSLAGHADLVRVVAALRGRGEALAGELPVAVESLGFVRVEAPRQKGSVESPGDGPPGGDEVAVGEGGASAPPRAQPEVPFWQPYRFEWRTDEELDAADLRRREEVEGDLAADAREGEARAALASPEAEPLTPRSRLVPLLQRAVTAELRGREIDVPGLVRRWSRGELVRALPRVRRRGWPALVLLLDRGHHLRPFWGDQVAVRDLLRGMLGRAGLVVRFVDDRGPDGVVFDSRGRPSSIADGSLAGMPIVAVSDLGWYGGPAARRGWLRLGRELRAAGERIFALVPVPPSRWTPELAELWSAIAWERPRSEEDEGVEEGARVEAVVDLAALVRRLEPGLLRGLRGLVPGADVGTEADAWMHGDVEASAAGWAQVRREAVAERRGRLAGREEVARAAAVIRRWHWNPARKPELWHVEALEMAEVAPGAVGREVVAAAERFLVRLGRRAVRMAEEPGREVQVDAIRRWLDHVAAQAPGFLDPSGEVGQALQQAWGATHPPDVLPPRADPALLLRGRKRWPGGPKSVAVRQDGEALTLTWPEGLVRGRRVPPGGLVGSIWAGELRVVPVRSAELGERPVAVEITSPARIEVSGGVREVQLRTDRSTLGLRPLVKPRWARAIGRDHQGLWAEVEMGAVRFRMRWIPPGFFWMGSPVGEPGRCEDEVRHPVVLTRGYWLGETPVTQALWEAVMRRNPSRFVDPRRPVEQVSWENVQEFVAAMNGAIEADEDGAIFRLPSEAEWEYACRAGTESATYAGAMEIKGERNAPVLDRIAWYGGNSGVGYDLAEGEDSSKWPEKQREHSKAGTRPVKGKVANSWGLYDMLGNVWEWCEDAWLEDRSELVQEWQSAGRGAGRLPGRDAEMATRVPGLPADLVRRAGSVLVDPYFPGSAGDRRVRRGGGWDSHAGGVRAAFRYHDDPGIRHDALGFRLARGQGLGPPPLASSRVMDPAPESWDVFILYDAADAPVVRWIAESLSRLGLSVFFDEWEITAGDNIRRQLDLGLRGSRTVVLVLSRNSVKSPAVLLEYGDLLDTAAKHERRLIPVLLEDVRLPPMLATRLPVDLRGKRGDDHVAAIHELAAAIRGESPPGSRTPSTPSRSGRVTLDPNPSNREPSRPMMSFTQPSPRHKVFVSYHHAGDEGYKELLTRAVFSDAFVDLSVRPKEVDDNLPTERIRQIIRDEYIRDATVTIVLVGAGTWRRKHVDWEIDSSLRDTKHNPRTGLHGIVLPTYRVPGWDGVARTSYPTEPGRAIYCPNNIPPRLWDNVKRGFAIMRPWPSSPVELREWIHEAFLRRNQQPNPDLSYPTFSNNRSDSSNAWDPPVR